MSIPTSSEATRLIGLAERMGIPTEDAIHQVLMHLTHEQQFDEVIEAVRSLTRTRPSAGAKGTGSPRPSGHRRLKAS
jgi:ribosomal protein L12E/L44/L45/RPP1/RPP2